MTPDILFSIGAAVCLILGLIGAFVPVLPGPPLAWFGILLGFFSMNNKISIICLIILAVIAIVATALDATLPPLMTKKFGGSKAATTGCIVGLLIGLFFVPGIGIILGPFIGALIGENIHTEGDMKTSIKSALGAFLGFISGCGIKAITAITCIIIFILSFWYKI